MTRSVAGGFLLLAWFPFVGLVLTCFGPVSFLAFYTRIKILWFLAMAGRLSLWLKIGIQ